jgi:hypothetical protein
MAGVPMNSYLTPEQAAAMAGIEDPNDRMNTMSGMQRFANMLPQMNQIKERSNGRVVGRTDPMEGLAQMGSQLAGAYMNKNLMDKYGAIMDANNQQRMNTAKMIAEALRRAPALGAATPAGSATPATPGVAQAYPVAPQNPSVSREIPAYTPHEIDYYGGY